MKQWKEPLYELVGTFTQIASSFSYFAPLLIPAGAVSTTNDK